MKHRMMNTERGAALILALLVMLVLSGLGLVAMQAVTDSSATAGMHRLQVQSKSVSDAVNQKGIMRSGTHASSIHAVLQDDGLDAGHAMMEPGDFDGDDDFIDDVLAGDDDTHGLMRRGGFVAFSSNPSAGQQSIAGGMTLLDGGGFSAVESDFVDNPGRDIEYEYIVRDPVVGPRADGYGDEFCFNIVTVGSRSQLKATTLDDDQLEGEERVRQMQSLARNVTRTMIGPVECG